MEDQSGPILEGTTSELGGSIGKVEVEAKVETESKMMIRSLLNLDLNLNLPQMLRSCGVSDGD